MEGIRTKNKAYLGQFFFSIRIKETHEDQIFKTFAEKSV